MADREKHSKNALPGNQMCFYVLTSNLTGFIKI